MATFRPSLNAGSMALGSMNCRQRHRLGKGGERVTERGGEQTGGSGVTGNRQGTETGEAGGGEEAIRGGKKKAAVGRERSSVPGVLQRKKCRLYSELTISGTGGTEVWNRHSGECPRPTWTWASSRRRSALMGSTPASRPDTASSLRTRRADTAAEWHYFTGRRHFSRWRPSGSNGPTS